MRVIFSILFILFVNSFARAQFVFDSTNTNPVVGDSYLEYNADTTGIVPGPSGANQIWDFQNLQVNLNSGANHTFVTPIASPCMNYYLSPTTIEDSIYYSASSQYARTYYNAGNNSLIQTGEEICGVIYHNDTLLVYPFAYGSNYKNYFTRGSPCGCTFSETDSSDVTYDGYGTLLLPDKTYNNVARVVTKNNYFTGYGGPGGSNVAGVSYTYKWYESGLKFSVLTILIKLDSSKLFTSSSWSVHSPVKTVTVRDYNGIGINYPFKNNLGLNVFPNPAADKINLQSQTEIGVITISNFIGEAIYKAKITRQNTEIDIADFPKGVYILSAQGKNYKLIKE